MLSNVLTLTLFLSLLSERVVSTCWKPKPSLLFSDTVLITPSMRVPANWHKSELKSCGFDWQFSFFLWIIGRGKDEGLDWSCCLWKGKSFAASP